MLPSMWPMMVGKRMPTIIDTAPQWLIAIPAAVLLGSVLKLDILWVYLAMTLENIVKFIFGLHAIADKLNEIAAQK